MFTELPTITSSTPAERLQALKDSQGLLAGQPEVSTGGIFGGSTTRPRNITDPAELIRLAEYITTGHDYRDTHPEGKRRPVIKNITNVTVVAPPGIDDAEIEHFLGHVQNGDLADFIRDMKREAQARRDEGKQDEDPVAGDEK